MNNIEWSEIGYRNWGVYQRKDGLRYSIDSYLLAHFANAKDHTCIYDLGSGMGIVATLLAAQVPQAQIIGLELQPQLVELAQKSALRNSIASSCLQFREEDLRKPSRDLGGRAHLVTANPPFYKIGHGALSKEDERYIGRHECTCNLDNLCQAAAYYLKQRGYFVMIYLAERIDEAILAASAQRLNPIRLQPIYACEGRDANLAVLTCCYEGRQPFSVAPPFYLNDAQGKPNPTLLMRYQTKET